MGRTLLVLLACGCLYKPRAPRLGGDARGGSDAPADVAADAYVVPHCAGVAFAPTYHDFYSPPAGATSPVVTGDGAELWFVAPGGSGASELHVAYSTGGGAYSSDVPAAFDVCSSASCFDPSPSEDGKLLFFLVGGTYGGCGSLGAAAYFAERGSDGKFSTTAQPVSAAIALNGVDALAAGVGGNALYYTNQGDSSFYQVTRPDRTSAFSSYTDVLTAGGLAEAGISPDSLELFYPQGSEIDTATRGDRQSMFVPSGTQVITATGCQRPSVSADATRLYLVDPTTRAFAYLSRTCP